MAWYECGRNVYNELMSPWVRLLKYFPINQFDINTDKELGFPRNGYIFFQTFAKFLRIKMKRVLRKLFLLNLRKTEIVTQNVFFYRKLTKIEILSTELNN